MARLLPILIACSWTLGCQAQEIVRVAEVDSTILQEMRYFGSNNFIGRPIDGYEAPSCMMSPEAAAALSEAQRLAQVEGLSLLAYDCYRPQRAVTDFVVWARDLADTTNKALYYPDVPKSELFERGYISSRSGHSRASTIDLTLARAGQPLEMGTSYDFFGEPSHTAYADISAGARTNRDLLKRIMEAAGFRNYTKEWWHYTLIDEPYPDTYFNRPVQ